MPELLRVWECCICGRQHDNWGQAAQCEDKDLRRIFSEAQRQGRGRQFIKAVWSIIDQAFEAKQ
jgi:hypothetical protein